MKQRWEERRKEDDEEEESREMWLLEGKSESHLDKFSGLGYMSNLLSQFSGYGPENLAAIYVLEDCQMRKLTIWETYHV